MTTTNDIPATFFNSVDFLSLADFPLSGSENSLKRQAKFDAEFSSYSVEDPEALATFVRHNGEILKFRFLDLVLRTAQPSLLPKGVKYVDDVLRGKSANGSKVKKVTRKIVDSNSQLLADIEHSISARIAELEETINTLTKQPDLIDNYMMAVQDNSSLVIDEVSIDYSRTSELLLQEAYASKLAGLFKLLTVDYSFNLVSDENLKDLESFKVLPGGVIKFIISNFNVIHKSDIEYSITNDFGLNINKFQPLSEGNINYIVQVTI